MKLYLHRLLLCPSLQHTAFPIAREGRAEMKDPEPGLTFLSLIFLRFMNPETSKLFRDLLLMSQRH